MKGKNYLLFTSILIIAGALTGFILNIFSAFLPTYWHMSRLVSAIVCVLFFICGVLGLVYRYRYSVICVVLGVMLAVFSLLSIPIMFFIGGGSAPVGLILIGFAYFIIFGLYLRGVFLNKKVPKKEVYYIPADFVPVRHNS